MTRRVAIVGGGIAGVGCAWACRRAGFTVELFEANGVLGGNAKTHVWDVDGAPLRTGLSVLAWPDGYFHNYNALLHELGVATELAPPLRFFTKSARGVWAHDLETPLSRRYARDVKRWERLVASVRRINRILDEESASSLYAVSPVNPLHFVTLRRLARVFRISAAFWDDVIVPIHSSSFLTVNLDGIPASIAPALDDIISVARGGRLRTWSSSSAEVFERMSEGVRVHASCPIARVHRSLGRAASGEGDDVLLIDRAGAVHRADAVVFACPAPAARAMLAAPSWLEWKLLDVRYCDEDDATFLEGWIHSDASIFDEAHRELILEGYANYIERVGKRYENTFVLSSWVPAARGSDLPMLVSYHRRVDAAVGRVDNRRAHPHLCGPNLARAFLLRFIQGRRGTWYCGSYTTPGNGHDLSLLSGLVIAGALGAPYPFSEPRALADFERLRKLMLAVDDAPLGG